MEIKNQLRIRADSFSNLWIFGILAVCFLPSALHFLGMDFGTEGTALDYFAVSVIAPDEATDAIYKALSGSFSHTILEWTAFCTAIFTVILAFIHFSINRDLTTPIIGMALFSALILITGTGLFLVRKDKTKVDKRLPYVLIVSFLFGVVAYLIIHISAGSAQLPQTMFPDAFITRPYDVIPLFLFIFAGIFLFPKFHRMVPNLFTHALILSIVPHVITQLHMSFGSTNLFDTHFNIAHFVKIIAYFVPFIGLTLDYYKTYLKEKQSVLRLEQTNTILEKQKIDLDQNIVERKQREIERELLIKELEGKNDELERFTYTVSHDLKSPLITIKGFLGTLEYSAAEGNMARLKSDISRIANATDKMKGMLDELLELSRIGRITNSPTSALFKELAQKAVDTVAGRLKEKGAKIEIDSTPVYINGDMSRLLEVLENLVDNAAKFSGNQKDFEIVIGTRQDKSETVYFVRDNGIGIKPRFHEKIFGLFDKLNQDAEGTGIGLAIVRRIIEVHGGRIWVESEGEGKGATFCFTVPEISK